MKDSLTIIGIIVLVLAVVAGGIFGLGLMNPNTESNSSSSLPEAVVVVNGFHWGWVPEVLEPGPGVKVEIAPGAQGSQIIVPKNTNLTLILRNAAGNSELHESYEDRFRDFFMDKYGEAWMNMHQSGHAESEESMDDMHDESEDSEAHEDEETEADPLLSHTFFLEKYGITVMLPPEPESNLQMVRFVVDKAGEFRFLCTNFCGLGHADMQGVLVVE